ncbi:DUF2207 domain-containing protein [Pseudorhizobium flavum]|uniref:Putative membrane protein YgcG n=1 Tax=Pseudorhizobium flavum TaxID=1335061 RepID=A0A7W9YZD1_9HYPH|nr:DUF2207 domain-containing protein [Pseudorhizobium flavum]MBB6181140.1 putative membrane protein YgcG [Pseudorhizobium flavum]CAD6600345.1 hypothetical protein RFYW14_00757 [Pseudorhizobium flavum]
MLRLLLPVLIWFATTLSAGAAEFIRSYHSDIQVAADGELTVSETITVNAEGDDIRRGIFRDFPLTMEDDEGRTIRVGFDVISVTRDGEPEDWHTESIAGGIRIYTGSQDVFLDRGEHTYVITYRTDRQIRYFGDHDELYWNVTGNGWMFRIDQASARVTLPDSAAVTETVAYTGPLGAADTDANMRVSGNTAVFSTTKPLAPNEGLTIVVGIPKGVIAPPSAADQRSWWLRDNINAILGFGGLALVALYYARNWTRVGRDPAGGVMVPRWDPPEGLSPALVNYVDNKGFSGGGWTALSASAIDLAVKGYVTLEDLKNSITIRRTDKTTQGPLPAGQAALLKDIGAPGEQLIIDKANGTKVQTVGMNFRRAIEKEHRGKYYRANTGYVIGGIALSVAALLLLFLFGDIEPDLIFVFMVPVFFAAFFGGFAVSLGKNLRRGSSLFSKIIAVVILGFIALVAISAISTVLVVTLADLSGSGHWPLLVSVGGVVLVNVIFFFLMGAPTPLGRRLMDGIEGLRTYLSLAEKDRMNMAGAPEMSPQHFETLLPYAVALGVEKPWSRAFETWLATAAAGAAAASYSPVWYEGQGIGHFGDRIGGFSSSMASTIASTIPAPKSSSSSSGFSSGGGFSGGGGGGGGGGGW